MSTDTPPRLLRKADVAARTGLTPRGIDNRVRDRTFPRPVLLDARQTAWVESEVDDWVRARVLDRDTGFVPPSRERVQAARQRAAARTAAKRREVAA